MNLVEAIKALQTAEDDDAYVTAQFVFMGAHFETNPVLAFALGFAASMLELNSNVRLVKMIHTARARKDTPLLKAMNAFMLGGDPAGLEAFDLAIKTLVDRFDFNPEANDWTKVRRHALVSRIAANNEKRRAPT